MKNPISSLKEKVTQYIQLRFELLRLEVVERLVSVMGYFAFIIVAAFLLFSFGIFFFLGIAEWFNDMFQSRALGYFITAVIILVISLVTILSSKRIIRFFANKMLILLTKKKNSEADEVED